MAGSTGALVCVPDALNTVRPEYARSRLRSLKEARRRRKGVNSRSRRRGGARVQASSCTGRGRREDSRVVGQAVVPVTSSRYVFQRKIRRAVY